MFGLAIVVLAVATYFFDAAMREYSLFELEPGAEGKVFSIPRRKITTELIARNKLYCALKWFCIGAMAGLALAYLIQ